jgi:N-acetylmuramoyl-L-alanine amidase
LDKERLYPRYIVIHHTGSIDVSIIDIDRYHRSLGWGVIVTSPRTLVNELIQKGFTKTESGVKVSVGYHYLIRKDGKIKSGRPDFVVGAHCRHQRMNFDSIGISLTGNFHPPSNPDGKKGHVKPTVEQVNSLLQLIENLAAKYYIPEENILLHKEVKGATTSCPGDNFKKYWLM